MKNIMRLINYILKKQRIVMFLIYLFFVLSGCLSTKSGNTNFNRNISIKVVSGNISINISGHISEDIYFNNLVHDDHDKLRIIKDNTKDLPVVSQGKKTINQNIILYERQEYKYTLATAEVVIMTIKTLDDNDTTIVVIEYGKEREYKIIGQNKLGQIISFRN